MNGWKSDELERIGAAEEIQIAARRRASTLRDPVPVWVVRRGDDLYVRSVNGRTAAWFRGTQVTHGGRIRAGGITKDVTFEVAGGEIDEEIDAAYRAKLGARYPSIVPRIVSPTARAATLKLTPRAAEERAASGDMITLR